MNMILPFTAVCLLLIQVQSYQRQISSHSQRSTLRSKSINYHSFLQHAARNDDDNDRTASTTLIPTNRPQSQIVKPFLSAATAILATLALTKSARAVMDRDESIYKDTENGFSVVKLVGWSILPKQPPTISLQKFQPEEVIFVASSFLEGASLTVTRTAAGRLLKDFNIDWWFAPLNSMSDVGSADLISRLLSLQHQEVSEKRGLPERVFQQSFVSDSEFEKREAPPITRATISGDGILSFEYLTPLAGTDIKTVVKAYFRNNCLIVVWISALASVWGGEYGERLNDIKDSFTLVKIEK